jgi:hypothetical protein
VALEDSLTNPDEAVIARGATSRFRPAARINPIQKRNLVIALLGSSAHLRRRDRLALACQRE